MLPFSSPSLLSPNSNAQGAWASSIFHAQKEFGRPLCLLVFRPWLLHNQGKKSKRRREEKDQGKDQEVYHDSDFVQIRRMIVLREERSTPKRTVPSWSWVDIHRGWILIQLRKNYSLSDLDLKKNYKTDMWFDHIFNFSMKFNMCSILAYEVDPCILYFMHVWFRLNSILIFYFVALFRKKILKHTCMP